VPGLRTLLQQLRQYQPIVQVTFWSAVIVAGATLLGATITAGVMITTSEGGNAEARDDPVTPTLETSPPPTLTRSPTPESPRPTVGATSMPPSSPPPSQTIINLTDLEPVAVTGGLDTEVVYLSGERYLDSLAGGWTLGCNPRCGGAAFDLGRNYVALRTMAGLSDQSAHPEAEVILEITGDSRQLLEQTLVFGLPLELDLDVTGILRLELRWLYLNPPGGSMSEDAQVVFGTPVLEAEPGYDPDHES
jgi:hypothetical protein